MANRSNARYGVVPDTEFLNAILSITIVATAKATWTFTIGKLEVVAGSAMQFIVAVLNDGNTWATDSQGSVDRVKTVSSPLASASEDIVNIVVFPMLHRLLDQTEAMLPNIGLEKFWIRLILRIYV